MSFILLGILNAQAEVADAGSYDLLETTILSSTQTTVTFTGLNSTYGSDYKHLQIRMTVRGDRSSTEDFPTIIFNNTGASHNSHGLGGNGSSVFSYYNSASYFDLGTMPANTATANVYGALVVDILDAFDTSKNTTGRGFNGDLQKNQVRLVSGLYAATTAVDEIDIAPSNDAFVAGSRFSLYGIKAA